MPTTSLPGGSMSLKFRQLAAALLFACWAMIAPLGAAEPLHVRIDQAIEAALDADPAPAAGDAEFVRRIYLDLTGKIPSVEQTRAFLADAAPDKRERLIDRLLTGPQFPRRMQHVFDMMLMERRSSNQIPAPQWQQYLYDSFVENKPYDQLVREILSASGDELRPAARFYIDRAGEANLLTRDVGRLFLGRDMQCAQCHDHPVVGDYSQRDYYGIYAFFNRSFVFTDAKKQPYFAERGEGDVAFKSVFDSSVDVKNFLPRVPGGEPIQEPQLAKGEEYLIPPTKTQRPFPKFSRRDQLADALVNPQNSDFNENIANRLWAEMLGRGLVHPVGWHHSDNPASHPELLKELGREFAAMKYDIRGFIRQLALSKTYQRSSEIPAGMSEEMIAPQRYAVAVLKPLSAEQLGWSVLEATGVYASYSAAAEAQFTRDPRLESLFALDDERQEERERQIETEIYNRLQGTVNQFVTYYGSAEGEPEGDFQASVHQALFFSNGATIRSWLNPAGNTSVKRASQMEDPRLQAEELYLSILNRPPSDQERLEAVEYVIRRAENPTAGLQEIAWALLASAEFRLNH